MAFQSKAGQKSPRKLRSKESHKLSQMKQEQTTPLASRNHTGRLGLEDNSHYRFCEAAQRRDSRASFNKMQRADSAKAQVPTIGTIVRFMQGSLIFRKTFGLIRGVPDK